MVSVVRDVSCSSPSSLFLRLMSFVFTSWLAVSWFVGKFIENENE